MSSPIYSEQDLELPSNSAANATLPSDQPLDPAKPLWEVQVSKGTGKYKTRFRSNRFFPAWTQFTSLHVHSGFNKRLLRNKVVIVRVRTDQSTVTEAFFATDWETGAV